MTFKKLLLVPGSILSGLMLSAGAFAQTTGATGVVDPTAAVASVTGNLTSVVAIGAAVMAVVVAIAALKWSRRAL